MRSCAASHVKAGDSILKRVGNLPIKHEVVSVEPVHVVMQRIKHSFKVPAVRHKWYWHEEDERWYTYEEQYYRYFTRWVPIFDNRVRIVYKKTTQGRLERLATTVLPPSLRVQVA